MGSRRLLGITALVAVVASAISFAVVDVTIADANGCLAMSACTAGNVPPTAVTFLVIGAVALVISIVTAIRWFVDVISESIELEDAHDSPPLLG